MNFTGKITAFFRRSRSGRLDDVLCNFFSESDHFPLTPALSLAFCFLTRFRGEAPTPPELRSLRMRLLRFFPEEARLDDALDHALTHLDDPAALRERAKELSTQNRIRKIEFFAALLMLSDLGKELDAADAHLLRELAEAASLGENEIAEILQNDHALRLEREKVLNSGAGLILALLVLLLFILTATYLKVVFFGFLLAYLFLPLEKFYEKYFFRSRIYRLSASFLRFLLRPLRNLKQTLGRRTGIRFKIKTPEEQQKARRESLAFQASVLSILTLFAGGILLLSVLIWLLLPFVVSTGTTLHDWAKKTEFFTSAETAFSTMLDETPAPADYLTRSAYPPKSPPPEMNPGTENSGTIPSVRATSSSNAEDSAASPPVTMTDKIPAAPSLPPSPPLQNAVEEKGGDHSLPIKNTVSDGSTTAIANSEGDRTETALEKNADSSSSAPSNLKGWLRNKIKSYVQENSATLAGELWTKGKGVLAGLLELIGILGSFALDSLLCLFFFFFFLQKMALFGSLESQKNPKRRAVQNSSPSREEQNSAETESMGGWTVAAFLNSGWLPRTNERTRAGAALIIDRIYLMFNAWIRGYFWIMFVETLLYLTMFMLFSVPYAPVLALIAGCTILLPFLGPLLSFLITASVCIAFADAHLAFSLVGVCLAYSLINGLLEQFFLYPTLVGEAIGLTTLETIIVVLLGAVFAGISGMIFAVPAAALLKYLIPKIYRVWNPPDPD